MNDEREAATLCLSDPIEETLMLIAGEGCGEELKVGNENEKTVPEKKKIFFFGQPGCLKNSPIKPTTPENHNNHNKTAESSSTADKDTSKLQSVKRDLLTASDDDDGNLLLQKISEALGDESENDSAKTSTATNDNSKETQQDQSIEIKSEKKNDSQSNNGEKTSEIEVLESVKKDAPTSVNNDIKPEDNQLVQEPSKDVQLSKTSTEKPVLSSFKSIVPYDDDSTSSSTHIDAEKDETSSKDQTAPETPQLDKSASSLPVTSSPHQEKINYSSEPMTVDKDIKDESNHKQTATNESTAVPTEILEAQVEKMELEESIDNKCAVAKLEQASTSNNKMEIDSSSPNENSNEKIEQMESEESELNSDNVQTPIESDESEKKEENSPTKIPDILNKKAVVDEKALKEPEIDRVEEIINVDEAGAGAITINQAAEAKVSLKAQVDEAATIHQAVEAKASFMDQDNEAETAAIIQIAEAKTCSLEQVNKAETSPIDHVEETEAAPTVQVHETLPTMTFTDSPSVLNEKAEVCEINPTISQLPVENKPFDEDLEPISDEEMDEFQSNDSGFMQKAQSDKDTPAFEKVSTENANIAKDQEQEKTTKENHEMPIVPASAVTQEKVSELEVVKPKEPETISNSSISAPIKSEISEKEVCEKVEKVLENTEIEVSSEEKYTKRSEEDGEGLSGDKLSNNVENEQPSSPNDPKVSLDNEKQDVEEKINDVAIQDVSDEKDQMPSAPETPPSVDAPSVIEPVVNIRPAEVSPTVEAELLLPETIINSIKENQTEENDSGSDMEVEEPIVADRSKTPQIIEAEKLKEPSTSFASCLEQHVIAEDISMISKKDSSCEAMDKIDHAEEEKPKKSDPFDQVVETKKQFVPKGDKSDVVCLQNLANESIKEPSVDLSMLLKKQHAEQSDDEDDDDVVSTGDYNDFPEHEDSEGPLDSDDEEKDPIVEKIDFTKKPVEEPICLKKTAYQTTNDDEVMESSAKTDSTKDPSKEPVKELISMQKTVDQTTKDDKVVTASEKINSTKDSTKEPVKESICIKKTAYQTTEDDEVVEASAKTDSTKDPSKEPVKEPISMQKTVDQTTEDDKVVTTSAKINSTKEPVKEPICIKKTAYQTTENQEVVSALAKTDSTKDPSNATIKEAIFTNKIAHKSSEDKEEASGSKNIQKDSSERFEIPEKSAIAKNILSSDKFEIKEAAPIKLTDFNKSQNSIPTKIIQPVVEKIEEEIKTSPKTIPDLHNETRAAQKVIQEVKNAVKETVKHAVQPKEFSKPALTRKRKISERKSISESDSESNVVADSVSHDNSSEDEEVVQKKKPRMRGKTVSPRKLPARKSTAATKRNAEEEPKEVVEKEVVEEKIETLKIEPVDTKANKSEPEATLQNFKFDYDGSEDIAAKVAAIRTLICKDPGPKKESDSEQSDDESKSANKKSRKTKRGRLSKRNEAESSSDDDDSIKKSNKMDSKRTKTADDQTSPSKKKRDSGGKGLLKYIDTSLVIETTENEAPVRQSRRIAQQKIREETERRQVEEKMLKQMKAQALKHKQGDEESEDEPEAEQKETSGEDESYKEESKRKKKSKILASDKQWQTSSSHSENSESDEYLEHVPSDPGSPLFKSDHEFSPESDDDDATQVQPVKRARTAKKLETVSEDEDINPNHACQVCHKTDSPEWILLCDECDCGYHCSCLKPIIFLIPSGNWYCPLCCHKKLIVKMSDQLTQLDTMIHNIETTELRKQRQKLLEISEQNILQERRKNAKSREKLNDSKASSGDSKESGSASESDDSSEDAPLKDYFYKLRKRNQTAAPSYRFNEYDDLINSAIRQEVDEVKGAGNLGRGKDISTIIEADNEDKELQEREEGVNMDQENKPKKNDGGESSGSDVIKPSKKSMKRKKKKLNNLDVSSEEERVSDEDFKGSSSGDDSEVDEEDLSMSSVSESSLDMPNKKGKGRNIRKSTRTREKRVDRRFINDNDESDSDDEPLVKAKRTRKKNDSDEEEFDGNDDDDEEGSLAEEIDSDDLCDDTETDDSSESGWPRKKKKRVAAYEHKPRKAPKKNENEDKAFRAGISKKKVLKKSDNEASEASDSDSAKGRRKTRGKKLLYLIEDDLDSDESDGIKPGVKRPETPPEEREMFVKKQEEIKRMLAAKDTEAAKKLAAPTIEPIHIAMERPKSPSPMPFSNEPASLSTIPKNVIESAKALDTDYNRIKPMAFGSPNKGNLQSNDMNEEELARMMEEEDFAQHQLKLAGEAIARKKLLDLEAKEEQFAAFTKANREKEWAAHPTIENKKRSRKSKSSEKSAEEFPNFSKALGMLQAGPTNLSSAPMPPLMGSNVPQMTRPLMQPQLSKPPMQPQPPSIIASLMQQQQHPPQLPSFMTNPPNLTSERPSVLSNFMTRPEMHPHHLKLHQPMPPEVFNQKLQPLSVQQYEEDEKKKGRRKKFTPLRTDLPEGNISKMAKLDPTTPSVIQSALNASAERVIDDKSKVVPRPDHPKLSVAAPPQIFNPATNPTPSVITRLLQPQQRPGPGPYPQGFTDVGPPGNPGIRMYASPEDLKNASANKVRLPMPQNPLGNPLPPGSFGEHPFVPRNIHPLYRGPGPYGIPPHTRLPPYPFHHLHPNLRPGEYTAPYNIPPQFSYYAPPAHSRQPLPAIPLNHGASQHAGTEDISNSIRNANNSEEPSETSEFGGLVSYFSSQQELD